MRVGGEGPVTTGEALPGFTVTITRADLVRYAGASGDFNPIHWDEATALAAGLPGVVAHGMLTMAHAARLLTTWAGPGSVREFAVTFARPLVVPHGSEGALLEVAGRVGELLPEGRARVEVTAGCGGVKLLGKARAVVDLPPGRRA